MKTCFVITISLVALSTALAENATEETPLTMKQLMCELRIQGGNFEFSFDKPTFAKVTVITTEYPEGKKTKEEFLTAKANQRIQLFFSASALFVGDYPRGDVRNNPRKMAIKLSDCEATQGTRLIHYADKFVENSYSEGEVSQWEPAVPKVPELEKEYILHWYFKKGDPYEAKATIIFSNSPFAK